MKTALHNEQIINLHMLNREDYQQIFDYAKRGNLQCPDCLGSVKLYLGIEHEPYFYHTQPSNKSCQEAEIPNGSDLTEPEVIERNGFIMPVSRSITLVEASPKTNFKKAVSLKNIPVFINQEFNKNQVDSSYLTKLLECGIRLDEKQAAAVLNTEGSLLVLAGAGSGKTRVLTARTAYMVIEKEIDPQSIMLVTFTAKAAAEMKERLLQYPFMTRSNVQKIVSGTFHSIFYRILSFHSPQRWNNQKLLNKEWQRLQILKNAGRGIHLDEKQFAYDLAIQQISFWKNSLLTPDDIHTKDDWEEKVKYIYQKYEEEKSKKGLFDFDDMLLGCYELFKNEPAILENYQNRFKYFLIDEFQDINKVQFELMKLLATKAGNICAVGDDDQSIYAFRGSNPSYLVDFEKEFPLTTVVKLEQNYRSSHEITASANQVIIQNKKRRAKKMIAQYKNDNYPVLFYPYDEEEEATMLITDIQEKIKHGFMPEDFAILYRTHSSSRAVFERLAASSLPFKLDQDAESFYDRFIVRTFLAFMRMAIDEENHSALKELLPSLFVKTSLLQDLKADSILNDRSLLECLCHIKTGFAFQEGKLKKAVPIIRSLKEIPPLKAIEKIEQEIGLNDFINKRGNEGNKLEKGSDDVRDLKVAAKNFTSIADFLNHADHMRAMNKEIKNLNKSNPRAITLSTIHRSKGLEYKNVYIIGAVDGNLPHDHALEEYRNGDASSLEEERRLMYVAMTRAKDYLYISFLQKRRGRKAYPSRFLSSLINKRGSGQ